LSKGAINTYATELKVLEASHMIRHTRSQQSMQKLLNISNGTKRKQTMYQKFYNFMFDEQIKNVDRSQSKELEMLVQGSQKL
jgi:hypothetical protein